MTDVQIKLKNSELKEPNRARVKKTLRKDQPIQTAIEGAAAAAAKMLHPLCSTSPTTVVHLFLAKKKYREFKKRHVFKQ